MRAAVIQRLPEVNCEYVTLFPPVLIQCLPSAVTMRGGVRNAE